jgi:hypothetical protein
MREQRLAAMPNGSVEADPVTNPSAESDRPAISQQEGHA